MLTESLVALQRGAFLLSGKHHCTCFPPSRGDAFASCEAVEPAQLPSTGTAFPRAQPDRGRQKVLVLLGFFFKLVEPI